MALGILDLASGLAERVPGSDGGFNFNQRWSPDGRWIAATPSGRNGLGVYSFESHEWTTLTPMTAEYLNWSHDSEWIYFCPPAGGAEEAVYRVSLATRTVERVTSLSGTRRAFNGVYGQWLGLTPDNSPLILRSTEVQQIYRLSFRGR